MRSIQWLRAGMVLVMCATACGDPTVDAAASARWSGNYPSSDSDRVVPFRGRLVSFRPTGSGVHVRWFEGGDVADVTMVKGNGDIWSLDAGVAGDDLWLIVASCSEKIARGGDFPTCPGRLTLRPFSSRDGKRFSASTSEEAEQLGGRGLARHCGAARSRRECVRGPR